MKQVNDVSDVLRRRLSHPDNDICSVIGQIMLPILIIVIMALFGVSDGLAQSEGKRDSKPTKEICITFDELPVAPGFGGVDIEALSFLFLEGLKKHKVKAVGFVVGSEIAGRHDILGRWLNEGHTLGNMTYSNQDYHELGIKQFLDDIRLGSEALEPMLAGFGQKKRYFRYPFLHLGQTVKGRRQAEMFIESLNAVNVTATVLPEDYLYNLRLIKMGKRPDSTEFELLLNEYINHLLDEVERCERVAKELVGREVKQILLLQANRLNAVYLDEMLTALEDMGYKFIPLTQALKDPVYSDSEAYYGTSRLGWLDRMLASDPDLLPAR